MRNGYDCPASFSMPQCRHSEVDLRHYEAVRGFCTSHCRRLGEGLLAYRYAMTPENQDATAWLIELYGDVRFLGITVPTGARPRQV